MYQSTAYQDGYWTGQLLRSLIKKVKTRRHVYKAYSGLLVLFICSGVVIVSCFLSLSRLGGFKHQPQQDQPADDVDMSVTTTTENVYPQDSF